MPEGDLRRNPQTGDTFQLQKVGPDLQWVELNDEESSAAQSVAEGGAAMSFLGGATRGLSMGLAGPPAEIEAQQQLQNPTASLLGELSPLAVGGLGALGGRAKSVAAKIGQKGQAARASQQTSRLIRRPSNILGRGTAAGATARHVEAGLEAIPGANIGLLYQKAANQRTVNGMFGAAMGLSDEAVQVARKNVNDVTGDVLQMFRGGYGAIKSGVDDGLKALPMQRAEARSLIDEALIGGYLKPKLKRALKDKATTTADDITEAMADLREVARAKDTPIQVVREVDDVLERFDTVLTKVLEEVGDDVTLAMHKKLNSRYMVWREMRKGRTISADGQINVRTADGRFQAKLGDSYLEGKALKDPEVNEFMQVLREGAALDVGLPSSGTTERAIAAGIIGAGGAAAIQ